jgi:endonuclease
VLALAASGTADGFLPVALSFAVLRVPGSASRLGLVLAAQAAIALLVTPAGGLLPAEWTCFSLIVLAPLAVLGPVISQQDLGGARAWGLISSALAAGAVGGQVIAGRCRRPGRPALVIAALVPVMTAEALALGLGAPLAVSITAAAVAGLATGAQAVLFPVAMQTAVPSGLLARVAAIDLLASEAGQPAGYALAGSAAAAIGAHAVLAAGAAGLLAAAAAFAWLRPLRVPVGRPQGLSRGPSRGCGRAPLATAAGPVQFAAVRIVIARCSVDYAGRLSAHLPLATRLIMIKADGSVLVHSDGGSYKPLNWMSPPCRLAEEPGRWVVTGKSGETLTIELNDVLSDSSWDLGVDPGLVKDGVESHLQELLAAQLGVLGKGWRLVRREFPTAIGPVDLMCRDAAGGAVAIEIKRRGEIDGVEQLTRYLELLNRDPLLAPVRGIFAAQEIRPQARVLAEDRGISCLILDYEAMRGTDDGTLRLF